MCEDCCGNRVQREQKLLEIEVSKGSPNGTHYFFPGAADERPGTSPGDVNIILQELEHENFKRRGPDLLMEKEITIAEALTGVDFVMTHLDGRKLRVKSKYGDTIKPNDVRALPAKGLPFHNENDIHGNLFILFKVKLPT